MIAALPSPVSVPRPVGRGLYAALWRFAKGSRLTFVAAITLQVVSQALKLSVPWIAGHAIDVLQTGGTRGAPKAGLWVLALLATSIAIWAVHGPARMLERSVGIRVRRSVTDALFDKLANAPLKWHDGHPASDLQQRMSQAAGALDEFTQNQYLILQGVVTFVGTLVALLMFSPSTGAIAIAGYVLLVVGGLRFDRAMMRITSEENEAQRRFSSGLLEFVGGIVTITALRLQSSVKRQLHARLDAVFDPLKRSIRLNEAKWCFVDLMTTALTWTIVALYVWQRERAHAAILIGGVFVIYKYAEQAGGVVSAAASHFQGFAHCKVNFASAQPIWDAPSRIEPTSKVEPDWSTIEMTHVAFSHDVDRRDRESQGQPGHGIRDVDLTIRRGERIALVGPSGSGKSTLMRVMAGLYPATQGRMTVDGVGHLSVRPLASITTFIPQDADLFETTLLENVALDGRPDADHLRRALSVSALDDVIATMPEGLATPIAERGINLSGGQRQRVGLARGVLAAADSSLILLDEPTSALDPLTEERVYREFDAQFPDACIVASVHRMSLLHHFDRVVLMKDGDLLDAGTVDELRARQPLFAAMLGGGDEGTLRAA